MATLINRVVRPLIGTLLALILGALAVGQMSAWWGAPGVLGYASNRTDRWNVYLLDTQRGLDWPSIVGETPLRPATFDWSPDCRRLVFVSNRPGGSVLGTLDLGTGTATQLRQNDTKFVMSYPRWSPDGTRILYAEDKTGTGRDVRVMDMTTGNISTLLSDLQGGAYPSWHPSGSHVIFTDTVDGQADIFTVDVTTRQRSQITDNATRESSPIYSPDGASIAYTDAQENTHILRILNIESGDIRTIAQNGADIVSPSWSPDGTRLAYARGTGSPRTFNVFVYDRETGRERQVTRHPEWNLFPIWSPCG